MKLVEIAQKGVMRARHRWWSPTTYLLMEGKPGKPGADVLLYSRATQERMAVRTPQRFAATDFSGDEFDAYTGKLDAEDVD